jgi:ubiquitin conjugation factor E4 B
VGAIELLPYLFPADIESSPKSAFRSQDLAALLSDLARRFSPSIDNDQESGFENVIGPLINSICKSLVVSKCDIGGGGQSTSGQGWRESLEVLLNLMSVKSIAAMVPKVMNWNATINPYATAPGLEVYSLLGPVLRLSTFPDAFVSRRARTDSLRAANDNTRTAIDCSKLFPYA